MSEVNFTDLSFSYNDYSWEDTSYSWDSLLSAFNWETCSLSSFLIGIKESLSFSNTFFNVHFSSTFISSFFVLDSIFSSLSSFFFNTVLFRDSSFLLCSCFFVSSLSFLDVLVSKSNFSSIFSDFLSISDSSFFLCSVFPFSHFFVSSECLSGFGFIISNLSFFSRELSLEDLADVSNRPFGYSNFQEFKVGEYDYKNAIVKLSIDSTNLNYSTAVDSLSLHVDIPDTDDRGVATIPASVTYVKFNKSYYNPPEDVSLAIKGGTTGDVLVPKLIDVDVVGFHVCILNSSGNMVSGQISWASKGY